MTSIFSMVDRMIVKPIKKLDIGYNTRETEKKLDSK